MSTSIRVAVESADALRFRADVLVLKHAQAMYGADRAVFQRLIAAGLRPKMPRSGTHKILSTEGLLGSNRVLFIGVKDLADLGYSEIRDFGYRAMSALRALKGNEKHVALTIHGPGYGLDETECFESELAGAIDAIATSKYPTDLEVLSFVEQDRSRAKRLRAVLKRLLPKGRLDLGHGYPRGLATPAKAALRTAGRGSAAKPRVFVAMPFADSMNDVFHYGIQGAVNSAGLLAERADLAAFVGDVMEWVKERIAGANLVIADVTGGNPNVYLEVGYAWGKGVPTVLLAKSSKELKFDVQGQRCIVYSSIKDLEQKLAAELEGLLGKRS